MHFSIICILSRWNGYMNKFSLSMQKSIGKCSFLQVPGRWVKPPLPKPLPANQHDHFIACHLLKAAQWWTDIGLGSYQLYFIRDKEQREVDFLLTRNNQPWLLVEVKSSGRAKLSPHLARFQEKTGAPHALQVAIDHDYVDGDCFLPRRPTIVPAKTFLSQLV